MITVIMPVLNAMPYLPEALASLESQSFKDFEVLIWDNGSVDGSLEEARRWIPSRVKGQVVSGNPLPLHECLAAMVLQSKTEFLARMDGDDISHPDRFQLEFNAIWERPEVGVVGGQIIFIDMDGSILENQEFLPCKNNDIITQLLCRNPVQHAASIFRKSSILSAGNYIAPKPIEDIDLYLRLVDNAEFLNLDMPIYKYRMHPESVCKKNQKEQVVAAHAAIARHSKKVFGLDGYVCKRLREKKSPCALAELMFSCFYRSGGSARVFSSILFSPWFVMNGRYLTGSGDYLSRIGFRIIDQFAGQIPVAWWGSKAEKITFE